MRKITRKSLDELAKTLPVIEESFQMNYVGGGNGTSASPYTMAEFDSLCSSNHWSGGYVEGMGYVANNVYIMGSSTNPGQTSQNYLTFPDYITSVSVYGANQVVGTIMDIIGTPFASGLSDMHRNIQVELLGSGYDSSSSFVVARTFMGDSTVFSIYDASNGRFITSRTIDTSGTWK